MPGDLARRFKGYGATATLPVLGPVGEATFVEGYGMVETGGGVATKISPPLLGVGLGDSLGVPMPGYRFQVTGEDGEPVAPGQEGELWVRGRGKVEGYWGSPEATSELVTEDGWVRTGDLARRGFFGTAVFAGRKKDVILNGGYTVYAREVEAALEDHPDVVEAGVTGGAGRPPGRGAGRRRPPGRRGRRSPPTSWWRGPASGCRTTRRPGGSWSSTSCPRPAPRRCAARSCSPCSTDVRPPCR